MTDSSYDENDGAQVLKTDVLGRVKTYKAQRERLLDEFERSGLSGTKFAAVVSVNYQTFASWVQNAATGAYAKVQPPIKAAPLERQRKAESLNPALQWLEAVVVEDKDKDKQQQPGAITETGPCTMKLYLPGGGCVDIGHAGQIPLAV